MSAVVAVPPVKPGDQSTPGASPAAPAAVEFRYTQTDSFVDAAPARGVAPGQHLPGQQAAGRARSSGGVSTLVRTFDSPWAWPSTAAGWRWARARRSGPSATPPTSPRGSSPPASTTPASCRARPRHRGHRRPRTRLGGRRAVGGQHALLVPLHAGPRLQLRAAVAAAVRHRPGRRGPLPPERPGHRGRPAAVRHRPGRDRHGRRLAGRQAARRLPDRRDQRRGHRPRPVDAALAALARRPAVGAGVRDRAAVLVDPATGRRQASPSCPASPAAWRWPGRTRSSGCRRSAPRRRWTACRWPTRRER